MSAGLIPFERFFWLDLYLIQGSPDHQPVPPSSIIFAGDSAGGGLVLALLQLLRNAGTPRPAGAILISPWCDLTHSFPSVDGNSVRFCHSARK